MQKLFAISTLLIAFTLPAVAQGTHLSLSDQRRFDSYYSRWQEYKRTNNASQVTSMERRMQDVYQHYGIPANTPYRNVSTGGNGVWGNQSTNRSWDRDHDRDRDRDWDRDRDRDRDRDGDRDEHHDRGLHRGWYKHHGDDDDDRGRDHDRDRDRDHDRDRDR